MNLTAGFLKGLGFQHVVNILSIFASPLSFYLIFSHSKPSVPLREAKRLKRFSC